MTQELETPVNKVYNEFEKQNLIQLKGVSS